VSGALGSLGAALAAGVPVVVAPQLFDQVWHGQRVQELGVGLMALRPGSVVKAVARIDADPSYRERARALGEELRAEDGAGALADAVEQVLASA
jgi:UDP:flavonoid glycosyltransferase YjiC (YdhE family)